MGLIILVILIVLVFAVPLIAEFVRADRLRVLAHCPLEFRTVKEFPTCGKCGHSAAVSLVERDGHPDDPDHYCEACLKHMLDDKDYSFGFLWTKEW